MRQKDMDELEEYLESGKFFFMMTGEHYRLGDKVTTDLYNHSEVFTVVGIRDMELELKGDWSGGTHNVEQTGWYHISRCRLVLPEFEWRTIKENGKEIKTS